MVVEIGPRHRERRLERGGGQVRERRGDAGKSAQRLVAGQVGGRDPQEPEAVGLAHRVDPGRPRERGDRDVRVGVGLDGREQLGADVVGRDAGSRGVVEQDPQALGVGDERVAQRDRRADDREQPRPRRSVLLEDPAQDVAQLVVDRPGQLREREQGLVRVGDVGQRGDEQVGRSLDDGHQSRVGEHPLRANGVGDPGARQPPGERRAATRRRDRHRTGRNRRSSYGVTCAA